MLKKEVYRIWYKEKYMYIIVVFLIIEIIGFCQDTYSFSWKSVDETKYYQEYMEDIEGKYEAWKGQKIEKDLLNETIMKVHYQAMNEINLKYQYVKEDPDNRQFTVPNAIELYFMNLKVDWLFLIVITILCVLLISNFYSSGTIHIIQTSKNGREIIAVIDTIILMISILALSLLSMFLQIGIYGSKWGFSSIHATIESMVYFSSSTKNISLYLAFACIFAIRTSAYLIYGLLVFGIVAIVKKPLPCFTIGVGIVFFPYYILNNENTMNILYRTWIPLGSLIGLNHFAGSIENIEGQVVFTEMSIIDSVSVLLTQFMVALIIWTIGLFVFSGKKMKIIKRGKLIGAILIISMLTGCTAKMDNHENINGKDEMTGSFISVDEYNIYDLKSGQKISVKQTINDNTRILALGTHELLVARSEVNGNTENAYSVEIYNPKTQTRKCIIRFGNNNDLDGLLDLNTIIDINMTGTDGSSAETNMGINESVAYEDDCLYYAYENVVVRANCISGEYKIIYHTAYMNTPIIDNKRLYYINSDNQLVIYSFRDEKEIILQKQVQKIWKYDDFIFFVKIDSKGFYLHDLKKNNERIVSESITPEKVIVNDSVIGCQDLEGKIYLIQKDNFEINTRIENGEMGELAGISQNMVYLKRICDGKLVIEKQNY